MVNALAPGLNTIPLTAVLAEVETLVTLEEPNVAVSVDEFGTVIVQGVGGSFDVMAGLVPRAPVWMRCPIAPRGTWQK